MAFEGLSEKLSAAFKKLKSKGLLTESDVKVAMREVRLALLEADVNYKVTKEFVNKVSERAVGEEVMKSLTPAQQVIKIVNEELTQLMGGTNSRIASPSNPPAIILLCGLQGAGKTTHAAKLAKLLKSQGRRPLLVACDIYRPAAIDQLKVMGAKVDVPVFEMGKTDPLKIVDKGLKQAKDYGYDVVIIDTAGRLQIDEQMMDELKSIKKFANPHEILLVIDSMTGQEAVNVAKTFDDDLNITGVILTKLDADTRGGAALSIRSVTGKPIKFVGTGEKVDDIEPFHPDRMASRILGMGDVLSLIEKAESNLDGKNAAKMADKLKNNQMDYNDLLLQLREMRKMGPLKQLIGMIPGVGKQIKDVDIDEKQPARVEAIILSMTNEERANPKLMNPSRKTRIASGAGVKVEDVNRLIKQMEQMKKMMKQLNGKMGKKGRMPKGFPGMMPPGMGGMSGMGPMGGGFPQ